MAVPTIIDLASLNIAEQTDIGTVNNTFARSIPFQRSATVTKVPTDDRQEDVIRRRHGVGQPLRP